MPALVCWTIAAFTILACALAADPCDCLNWKEVYASGRVFCGEGLEFHVFEGALGYDLPGIAYVEKTFKSIYNEFCTTFFKRMDNSYCVNMGMYPYGMPGMLGGQWCYVQRECKLLNGGKAVPDKHQGGTPLLRDVNWKACIPGLDQRLRELPPTELLALAKDLGAELGFVTKIAYPRLPPWNYTWSMVSDAVARGDTDAMPAPLRAAIAADVPIVIDEDLDGHGSQRVVHGREVYEVINTTGWPYRRGKDVGEL